MELKQNRATQAKTKQMKNDPNCSTQRKHKTNQTEIKTKWKTTLEQSTLVDLNLNQKEVAMFWVERFNFVKFCRVELNGFIVNACFPWIDVFWFCSFCFFAWAKRRPFRFFPKMLSRNDGWCLLWCSPWLLKHVNTAKPQHIKIA